MGSQLLRRRRFLRGSLALAGLGLLSACRQTVPPASAPRGTTAPVSAPTPSRSRIPIVGILWAQPAPELAVAFEDGLRARGHVLGRTVKVVSQAADDDDQYPALAQELVGTGARVVVSMTMLGAQALQRVSPTVPIVLASSSHLVEAGLVTSLDRPGGNITGVMAPIAISARYPQLLKEALPTVSRVGVLWKPDDPAAQVRFDESRAAAATLGLSVLSLDVRTLPDIGPAFDAGRAGRIEAVIVLPHALTSRGAVRIVDRAVRDRLPGLYPWRESIEAGGLIAYGPSLESMCRRAAGFVDRILRGAKPAELPVEPATDVELLINLRAARALGLSIPPSLLQQATELMQ